VPGVVYLYEEHNQTSQTMNKSIPLAIGLFVLNLLPVLGQPAMHPRTMPATAIDPTATPASANPELTRFNLDFSGGTPAELVKAIEKATGKPLNAIIRKEDANTELPPLKMNDVTTPQLFAALEAASLKTVVVQNPMYGNSYSQVTTEYGFKTSYSPVTDSSIWYFHVDKPTLPPVVSDEKICRFYNLDPFLNRGFTVDDVTTAIQTGWKMAGISPAPELNYHKETKLLVAYGGPRELQTIQDVLQTLPQTEYSLPSLDWQMKQLQNQVDDLKKQVRDLNSSKGAAAMEKEKSGK
jgi:hypothetical protein